MSDELLAAIVGAVIGVIGGSMTSLASTGLVLRIQGRERAAERRRADQEAADRTHQDFLEATLHLNRCYTVVSSRLLPVRPDGILDATVRYLSALARVYALREPTDIRAAIDKVTDAVEALQESFSRVWALPILSIDPKRAEDVNTALGELARLRRDAASGPRRRWWRRGPVSPTPEAQRALTSSPAVGALPCRDPRSTD